ncbi:unnamed protein product, partial [Orchesella dallaii]
MCYEQPELEKQIAIQSYIDRRRKIMGVITGLAIFITIIGLNVTITRSINGTISPELTMTYLVGQGYWIFVHICKLLTISLWVCTIECFEIAFKALNILAFSSIKMKQIPWIIESYKRIETILKKFHKFFGIQLLSICFLFVLTMSEVGFAVVKVFRASHVGFWELSYVMARLPHMMALSVSFFFVCDAATRVHQQ